MLVGNIRRFWTSSGTALYALIGLLHFLPRRRFPLYR
jgi:hypothetical protein